MSIAEMTIRRRRELDITLESNGELSIHIGEQSLRVGPLALSALDVFSRPLTLHAGISALTSRCGVQATALDEAVATVKELLESGVLEADGGEPMVSQRFFPFGYYDSPGVHIKILSDRRRRSAYLAAIKEVVRPGDVVLDLGAGSGILGVAAARAGARRVYSIEPSGMARAAGQVAISNGIDGAITCVSDWSQLVDLPEPCDVLLFDLVGSEPLEMRAIEICLDALRRHLKPGARIVPQGIGLRIQLASGPQRFRDQYVYSRQDISDWREWYGIDFSPLLDAQPAFTPVYAQPEAVVDFTPIGAPVEMWQFPFADVEERTSFAATSEVLVISRGQVDAAYGIVDIRLSENITFSADPTNAGNAPHWMTPVWLAFEPIQCEPGDRFAVCYQYLGRGRSKLTFSKADGR
ncbi:50S ribosomal protein L11 methyltransferase [Mesorhizobium mediterraneum]|uniref:50S ribosomal protein L11 methyltransferase n=1 Tax=Mesorhizobium mediterraneum TaxID=43617 RepID=UPI00177C985B|nr:class I SAM-dependent methyltransferase [Mesorhizobium mediterraneum]